MKFSPKTWWNYFCSICNKYKTLHIKKQHIYRVPNCEVLCLRWKEGRHRWVHVLATTKPYQAKATRSCPQLSYNTWLSVRYVFVNVKRPIPNPSFFYSLGTSWFFITQYKQHSPFYHLVCELILNFFQVENIPHGLFFFTRDHRTGENNYSVL